MNIYTILVCLERLYQANCSNREVDPPLIFSWWTLHLSLLGSNYSSRRNCLNKLESELYQDLYIYIKLNIANNKLVVLEENWFFLKYSLFKVWIQVSEKKKCEKFINAVNNSQDWYPVQMLTWNFRSRELKST